MKQQNQLVRLPGTSITTFARGTEPSPESLTRLIQQFFYELGLPQAARDYVTSAIEDGPSRRPKGHYGNTVTRFRSTKAGNLWLESRSGEYALALLLDVDDDVITYFAQPPEMKLVLRDLHGTVQTRTGYTPDFLIVRKTGFVLIEQRDEGDLAKRALKNPFQFYKDEQHQWHYRACEEATAAIGLPFMVSSSAQLPITLASNARFLEDYLLDSAPPLPPEAKARLVDTLARKRAVAFRELRDNEKISADHIFMAVATGDVYVDLAKQRLDYSDDLVIFSDALICRASLLLGHAPEILPVPGMHEVRAGTTFAFDGVEYRVVLCGERDAKIVDEHGELRTIGIDQLKTILADLPANGAQQPEHVKRLDRIAPARLDRALERIEAVRTGHAKGVATSTIKTWARRYNKHDDPIDGLFELIDDYGSRGNRKPRITEANETLAANVIQSFFNLPRFPKKRTAFSKYVTACKERLAGELPMSEVTFNQRCDHYLDIRDREGSRAAYQKNPIRVSLNTAWPVHGCRPYEYLYIDSTPLDHTAKAPSGLNLGKPYATFGLDGATGKSMAFVCTFDAPSAWTVLLTLRDFVRREGRLPRTLSVDNGREFHNNALERFCAIYKIDLRYRAPARPRGGAPIERLIGATTDEVLPFMEGNTRNLRDNRLGTKHTDPFLRTEWTLVGIYRAVEDYLMNVRNGREHHAYGRTPNQLQVQMLADTGERAHKFQTFDENIMLYTCPEPKRPLHKYSKTHGIWCNHQWYRCRAMDGLEGGSKVRIKLEPWIDDVIYVQIGDRWHAAVCRDSRAPFRYASKEVAAARRAQRDVAKLVYRHTLVSGPHLFNKARYEYPSYFDRRLHERQGEMRHLYFGIAMGTAMPAQISTLVQQLDVIERSTERAVEPQSERIAPNPPALPDPAREEPRGASFMAGLNRVR